jgi:hypothetical protein
MVNVLVLPGPCSVRLIALTGIAEVVVSRTQVEPVMTGIDAGVCTVVVGEIVDPNISRGELVIHCVLVVDAAARPCRRAASGFEARRVVGAARGVSAEFTGI